VTRLMRADDGKARADGKARIGGEPRFAAGAVTGWYGARGQRIVKQALKRYRKFRGIKSFWD
jgi:hypothetical protein